MIQRIQTVYLTLAAICILIFLLGNLLQMEELVYRGLDINAISIAGFASLALTGFSILQFKKRTLQVRMTTIALLLMLIPLSTVIYYGFIWTGEVQLKPVAASVLIAIVFQLLALISIRKDERLVKSLDRLR